MRIILFALFALFVNAALIQQGSKWNYPPWGGVCTAKYVNGELWMHKDGVKSTKGTRIWKLTAAGSKKLQQKNNMVKVLWDNKAKLTAFMTNDNQIHVAHGKRLYVFQRVGTKGSCPKAPKVNLKKYFLNHKKRIAALKAFYRRYVKKIRFNYSKKVQKMRSNYSKKVQKMRSNYRKYAQKIRSNWKKLVQKRAKLYQLSKKKLVSLYIKKIQKIRSNWKKLVQKRAKLYQLSKKRLVSLYVKQIRVLRYKLSKCRRPYRIPHKSIWNYGPWGGKCIAYYRKGKLFMKRTNKKAETGTRIWKLGKKGAKALNKGKTVKILWDNRAYLSAKLVSKNKIRVMHGKKPYYFTMVKK